MEVIMTAVRKRLHLITGSIAFLPTFIATGLVVIAVLVIWIEFQPTVVTFKENIEFLLVGSIEDARLILGTLVASIISLMVFSFSMVMLVLSQASSNLSPRTLPGLITAKDNQLVLGFYLGTICYCLLLILNIHPGDDTHRIPALGTSLGLSLGIICLALFMYFIHSVSRSIQVDQILDRLLNQTLSKIDRDCCTEKFSEPAAFRFQLCTPKAGYLKWMETENLLKLCAQENIQIRMLEAIGYFYLEGEAYLQMDREIDIAIQQKIHDCFVFYPEENLLDHYSFGFKQISEIAVKALSKGLNDPATAIKAVDMLMVLFIHKLTCCEKSVLLDRKGNPRIYLKPISIQRLFDSNLTPIREYGKEDILVVEHLLKGLRKVLEQMSSKKQVTIVILHHIHTIRESCSIYIKNSFDRERINLELKLINDIQSIAMLTMLPTSIPSRETEVTSV